MSDIFRTPQDVTAGPAPAAPSGTVREAYSFACMNCGHGWEQSYEIVHEAGTDGRTYVVYYADRVRVPSPLTRPGCAECGGHLVRIMRSGRVASAGAARWTRPHAVPRVPVSRETRTAAAGPERRPWLAGLLALLHRKPHDGPGHPRAV